MSKRTYKKMTADEKKAWQEQVRKVEQDKPELMAIGKKLKSQHERLVESIMKELESAKERKGLSLADLSERTGFDRTSLSRLFNSNGNPTVMTLNRIADAVGKKLVIQLQEKE